MYSDNVSTARMDLFLRVTDLFHIRICLCALLTNMLQIHHSYLCPDQQVMPAVKCPCLSKTTAQTMLKRTVWCSCSNSTVWLLSTNELLPQQLPQRKWRKLRAQQSVYLVGNDQWGRLPSLQEHWGGSTYFMSSNHPCMLWQSKSSYVSLPRRRKRNCLFCIPFTMNDPQVFSVHLDSLVF